MPDINHLGIFLLGGVGAPEYAPDGVLKCRGISVEQLANASGITRTAIYNYINGDNRPKAAVLRQICEALSLPFHEGLKYCTPAPGGRLPADANKPDFREPRRKVRNDPTTPLAQKLNRLMQHKDRPMGIRDLSEALGITYEYARKLVRGESIPSRFILKGIAEHFRLDIRELESLHRAERLRREFGEVPGVSDWSEEMQELAGDWTKLTARQREIIKADIGAFASLNKAEGEGR
jgi:transcriptional regulator with XRE-family HTH domain